MAVVPSKTARIIYTKRRQRRRRHVGILLGAFIVLIMLIILGIVAYLADVYYVNSPQDAGIPDSQDETRAMDFPDEVSSTADLPSEIATFDGVSSITTEEAYSDESEGTGDQGINTASETGTVVELRYRGSSSKLAPVWRYRRGTQQTSTPEYQGESG